MNAEHLRTDIVAAFTSQAPKIRGVQKRSATCSDMQQEAAPSYLGLSAANKVSIKKLDIKQTLKAVATFVARSLAVALLLCMCVVPASRASECRCGVASISRRRDAHTYARPVEHYRRQERARASPKLRRGALVIPEPCCSSEHGPIPAPFGLADVAGSWGLVRGGEESWRPHGDSVVEICVAPHSRKHPAHEKSPTCTCGGSRECEGDHGAIL
jgi:hypothetical protein